MVVAFTSCVALSYRRPHVRGMATNGPPLRAGRGARRARWRMQDVGGEDAEDEAPSDTYVPGGEGVASTLPGAEDSKRKALTNRLLQLAAATSRGQLATDSQTAAMDDLVMSLEEINPNPQPVETDAIDGVWTLVYAGTKLLRSNAFVALALSPVLQVGQVTQKVSVDEASLITDVEFIAFPLTTVTVSTKASVTPVGAERLEVSVMNSTVTGGKIAEKLDLGGLSFDIPVRQIYSRIKNMQSETYIDTYYLDESLRISRSKQGDLYIYTRLA